MRLNFKGRVGKVQLSPNRALHPLFEAIVNSIHSIKDLKISDGRIDVIAEREESAQGSFIDNYDSRPIRNFIIQDNGVGFNQINFDSFDTSDTTLKEGAKGIGRFLWLITFDAVHIESVFSEDGRFYKRTFDFALTDNGVENAELSESNATERFTVVRLLGLKQRYQEKCEKGLETIADKIIEHCLYYFMQPKCPTITLSDGKEEINLNDLYNNNVKGRNRPEKFDINGEEFSIINLRLYLSKERKHRIFFCANERAVKSIDVSSRIPDISARKITDTNGDAFKYAAYVSGKFLDEKVNDERTDFSLPLQISDLEFAGEVSWEELVRRSTEKAREFLRPHLEPISQDKITRIKRYINEVAPQYKPIIKYKAGLLDDIKPGLSDDQLDAELYRIYHGIHSELRAHYKQLLSKTAEDVTDLEKYKQDYKTLVEQLNDVSKSELAQYVVHRKLILNLLEEALKIKGDGEYSYEDRIHQMIYPMRLTSDDVPYEQQNLWIIDERLNYHDYLASDKVLSTYGNLKTKSQCRPDIAIFGEKAGSAFDSVVLVEFKRPMRDDLTGDDKDPIRQLYGYTTLIKSGKLPDEDGRYIPVHSATRFFCYLICDINEQIKDYATLHSLIAAPDEQSYFGFHPHYQAYIEVISYGKLIDDAKKRNKVLFERLDLPDTV